MDETLVDGWNVLSAKAVNLERMAPSRAPARGVGSPFLERAFSVGRRRRVVLLRP